MRTDGLGDRIQLKVEIPWLVLDSGGATVGGLGNALLGVKYRFMDESVSGVSVAVYPQVEIGLLDSSVEKGLVESGTGAIFPIIAQRSFGRVSADVELHLLQSSGLSRFPATDPGWSGSDGGPCDRASRHVFCIQVDPNNVTHQTVSSDGSDLATIGCRCRLLVRLHEKEIR